MRGSGANWGGCQVWVSLDGTQYRQLDTVYGGARYGTLSAAAGAGATRATGAGAATTASHAATLPISRAARSGAGVRAHAVTGSYPRLT